MTDAKELFTPSQFDTKRQHPEYTETARCADWLRGEIHIGRNISYTEKPFPDLIFTHYPSEGAHGKEGFFLKRMGTLPNVFDFIMWWSPGKTGFVEMKANGNMLSIGQKRFDAIMQERGFHNRAVCYTAEEVRDTLIKWGLRYNPVPIPMRKLTHAEQLADQYEWMRPSDDAK